MRNNRPRRSLSVPEAVEVLVELTLANGRSRRTADGYWSLLRPFVQHCGDIDVAALTVGLIRKYVIALQNRDTLYDGHPYSHRIKRSLSPHSINTYLRAVKRLCSMLIDEGYIDENPAARIRLNNAPLLEQKAITSENFEALLRAAGGDTPLQLRDTALLLMLRDTGGRVGGISNLRITNIDLKYMSANVVEKGGKPRTLFFQETTRDALVRWLDARPRSASDYVFVNMGRRRNFERLTEDAIGEVLRRLKKRAGIRGKVNPHSFRHGFAVDWLENGGDIGVLSQILGHSDVSVTNRFYARLRPNQLKVFHRRYSPVDRALGDDADDGSSVAE